jgi:2',3'-cyclic-nucleotide 2'-phosphodiesterase (5'-nucleotidase family)
MRAAAALLSLAVAGISPPAFAGDGPVRLIHIGDIHGHLVPRANVRSDSTGRLEGGVARMYTVVKKIREEGKSGKLDTTILINTGDTLQGSGEALFTRGQAMVDVLNLFKIQAYTPGNWDFLYGKERFEELFVGTNGNPPVAPWNGVASNLYYTSQFDAGTACGIADANGNKYKRVLPPYTIKQVGKVKVGILGFTTARAIAAIGPKVTAGLQYTDGKVELPCYIDVLRNQEKVDLLVAITELELARDIKLHEAYAGVDVVLSSDMHEKTTQPIVIHHANAPDTIIVEEGQDGTMVGELKLKVKYGKLAEWEWKPHVITSDISEDKTIKAKVAEVRKPFVKKTFVPGQQVTVGGNTTTLQRPIDEIIAWSQVDLHRSNFMDEDMPAVVEGSSHNLIADAMRWAAGSDTAAIRGFRYGTHIPAGTPIRMNDIYHYVPVAAKLGKSPKACGADLKMQVEMSSQGVFHPDPTQWAGGWMFGYSNVSFDLDACDGLTTTPITPIGSAGAWKTFRGTNIAVGGQLIDINDPYDATTKTCKSGNPSYKVAGYWYADDPTTINNCNPCRGRLIQVMTNDGQTLDVDPAALPDSNNLMDVTEAMVKYLQDGLGGTVTASNLPSHRITVKRLPTINPYPFKVIQPLNGSSAATCPSL